VLPEVLFRDTLAREERRADRFDDSFVLVLVASSATGVERRTAGHALPWNAAVNAIAAVSDAAIVGWYEQEGILGAIVADERGETLVSTVRRTLIEKLRVHGTAPFAIECRRYTPAVSSPLLSWCASGRPEQRPEPASPDVPPYKFKRALDIIGSLALLTLLSPLFALIAILLRLTSPGPVLFKQTRVGLRGKPFTMLKFRSMRVNTDPALHHEYVTKFIRSGAELHSAGRKALFKLTNDPRVTPLGRILRKTSLDELPQFWNVLVGDMSLVGPRPPLPYEVAQYQRWHWGRVCDAKPGMTGLWQVLGRSRTTFDEMVRLDLRYARACSLATDLWILLATPRAVLSGKGAG